MQNIYVIYNKETNRKYVGRARNVDYRFKKHMEALKGHRHKSVKMQEDYDVYGADSFGFQIVDVEENCREDMKERSWMVKLKTYDSNYGYNTQDPCFMRHGSLRTRLYKSLMA